MLLQILTEERRERHRELKNRARNQKTFEIGDLVVVRKQLQSNAKEGLPAKLAIAKYKGPYRVIDKIGNRSYMLQKLPTFQGQGKPDKPRQYSGSVMEKIPSTMIVNKRLDTVDTRLAALEKPLVHNPLEQALGFYQFGRYVQAPSDADFAFDRVEELWNLDVSSDSDSSIDSDEEMEATSTAESPPTTGDTSSPTTATMESTSNDGSSRATRRRSPRFKHNGTPNDDPGLVSPKRKASADAISNDKSSKQKPDYESFYGRVEGSKDKVFIIAVPNGNKPKKDWFVVQVDWDETNMEEAKSKGRYHVRWYIRHFKDSQDRLVRNCRFWPEIHEMRPNDVLGAMQIVKPSKCLEAGKFLEKKKWVWYQQKVNLFADHIVGPFDFAIINGEPYRVSPDTWSQFRSKADASEVNLLNLDTQDPLPTWKR